MKIYKKIAVSCACTLLVQVSLICGSAAENPNQALLKAAAQGDPLRIRQLIAAGAHVDTSDTLGQTPLYTATMYGHAEAIEELLRAGANVHASDGIGQTALHRAANCNSLQSVKALLGAGANVNATNISDKTPLHVAAGLGYTDVTKELVTAGADVNAVGDLDYTPLYLALLMRHTANAQALAHAGAEITEDVRELLLEEGQQRRELLEQLHAIRYQQLITARQALETLYSQLPDDVWGIIIRQRAVQRTPTMVE